MPKHSLGKHLLAWDHLIATASRDGAFQDVQFLLDTLKAATEDARQAKLRQLELRAAAQQATRDLDAAVVRANEAAVRLNQFIVSAYGHKSEKLTEFGLRPWRTRRRKVRTPSAAPDETGEQSGQPS